MQIDDSELTQLASLLGTELLKRHLQLVVAESCTGGGIAQTITDVAGSSAWFERGFVTYSNISKQELLNVQAETLISHGAVSLSTALQMAQGALTNSHAQLSLAVTGIAGPDGGTIDKPVGTVFVAWQMLNQPAEGVRLQLQGNRRQIRQQVIAFSLQQLTQLLAQK